MRIWTSLSQLFNSPMLMERMMARFGVREALVSRPAAPEVIRRAAIRCMSCNDKDECRSWLDTEVPLVEVPTFCRNRDLIERLRREDAEAA